MSILQVEPDTLESVIRMAVGNAIRELRTVTPCKIKKINEDGTVELEIVTHRVFTDGTNAPLPSLGKVPVLMSGNADYQFSFPVRVGDEGLAVFCERDISRYVMNATNGPPTSLRLHSLSDAVFLPMPLSNANRVPIEADTLVLRAPGVDMKLNNGKLTINGDVDINGNVETVGTVHATAEVSSDAEVKANANNPAISVTLTGHTHIDSQSGPTQPPTVPEV